MGWVCWMELRVWVSPTKLCAPEKAKDSSGTERHKASNAEKEKWMSEEWRAKRKSTEWGRSYEPICDELPGKVSVSGESRLRGGGSETTKSQGKVEVKDSAIEAPLYLFASTIACIDLNSHAQRINITKTREAVWDKDAAAEVYFERCLMPGWSLFSADGRFYGRYYSTKHCASGTPVPCGLFWTKSWPLLALGVDLITYFKATLHHLYVK